MKNIELQETISHFTDDSEIVVAIPQNMEEGVYKIAMILPAQKKPTILLGE